MNYIFDCEPRIVFKACPSHRLPMEWTQYASDGRLMWLCRECAVHVIALKVVQGASTEDVPLELINDVMKRAAAYRASSV